MKYIHSCLYNILVRSSIANTKLVKLLSLPSKSNRQMKIKSEQESKLLKPLDFNPLI